MLLQLPSGTATMVAGTAVNQPGDSGESLSFVGLDDLRSIVQPK